jgi:hypothetical protein
VARTPTAAAPAFGVSADERPRGKRWGARDALEKRKEQEKKGGRGDEAVPF